jgi:hypothetical protein
MGARGLVRSIAASVSILGGACGRIDFDPLDDPTTGCTRWSSPIVIAELASPGHDDYAPELSHDGLEIYFTSTRDGGGAIYRATRPDRSSLFGVPVRSVDLDIPIFETDVALAGDDLELYMTADGTAGLTCLWRSTRASTATAWTAPVPQPAFCAIDSDGPALTPDGLTLFYNTPTRPDQRGTIYVTSRATRADAFALGVAISALAGGVPKGYATISATGLELYYEADGKQIWRTTRASLTSPFEPPTRIDEVGEAGDPAISSDGRELYLAAGSTGTNDVVVATRDCP